MITYLLLIISDVFAASQRALNKPQGALAQMMVFPLICEHLLLATLQAEDFSLPVQ